MSTHSFIGKQNQDGSVRAIYCHFDGYPGHVGKVLAESYSKDGDVDALLDLGDLSSLSHSLNETIAYGRDRGEEGVEAKDCVDHDDFIRKAKYYGGEQYKYLYTRSGEWKLI